MSQPKPQTMNAWVYGVEYIEANGNEITIELSGRRKAPKGSKATTGKHAIRLRLTLSSYAVVNITKAGRRGIEKLIEDAQRTVEGKKNTLEELKRAAA